MENIPWIEKYRPSNFKDIVLEDINKKILNNIINMNRFPNLLFYGPPGTGKTTTIINLINQYQEMNNQTGKEYKIHLNASDDRGIDIIRNQIYLFVKTKILFGKGIKFVILDEVDYMTKNAQQALRYLIQQYSKNVRFCLICNYISRIDNTLQNEFLRLRFCNLPKTDINNFLKKIIQNEHLKITDNQIESIQMIFKSDIRSMINYLQTNYYNLDSFREIIPINFWNNLMYKFANSKEGETKQFIKETCGKFNLDVKSCIKRFIKYLIRRTKYGKEPRWLNVFEKIIHNLTCDDEHFFNYSILRLCELYKTL
jgi:replication factor C subunit 3/5